MFGCVEEGAPGAGASSGLFIPSRMESCKHLDSSARLTPPPLRAMYLYGDISARRYLSSRYPSINTEGDKSKARLTTVEISGARSPGRNRLDTASALEVGRLNLTPPRKSSVRSGIPAVAVRLQLRHPDG